MTALAGGIPPSGERPTMHQQRQRGEQMRRGERWEGCDGGNLLVQQHGHGTSQSTRASTPSTDNKTDDVHVRNDSITGVSEATGGRDCGPEDWVVVTASEGEASGYEAGSEDTRRGPRLRKKSAGPATAVARQRWGESPMLGAGVDLNAMSGLSLPPPAGTRETVRRRSDRPAAPTTKVDRAEGEIVDAMMRSAIREKGRKSGHKKSVSWSSVTTTASSMQRSLESLDPGAGVDLMEMSGIFEPLVLEEPGTKRPEKQAKEADAEDTNATLRPTKTNSVLPSSTATTAASSWPFNAESPDPSAGIDLGEMSGLSNQSAQSRGRGKSLL